MNTLAVTTAPVPDPGPTSGPTTAPTTGHPGGPTTALTTVTAPTSAGVTGARTRPEPAIDPLAAPEPATRPAGNDVSPAGARTAGDAGEEGAAVDVTVPVDQEGIDALREQIDEIDDELVRLIQRRTAVSHAIGVARKQLGGPRIVYSREMAILERFRVLGPSGTDLGMLLLAMGRGKLGRK